MTALEIMDFFIGKGLTVEGAAGLVGNLQHESALKFNVLENLCRIRLKEAGKGDWSNEAYTKAVDDGTISKAEFLHPLPGKQYGYGLVQWTTAARKEGLYDLCKSKGLSIADEQCQLEYTWTELQKKFPTVYFILRDTHDVKEASTIVLQRFEAPANADKQIETRYATAKAFYDSYVERRATMDIKVYIGSARSNENGGINGGKAGDQTGGEVSIQEWYNHKKGWNVLRPIDPDVANTIARTMEELCANNNVGYCQDHRLTGFNAAKEVNFDITKISKPVEIDCSEAVRTCLWAAGIKVADFTTADEVKVLTATKQIKLIDDPTVYNNSYKLKRGDILVTKTKGHTVVVLNSGEEEPVKMGWNLNSKGWWYVYNEQGSYYTNQWALIDHHWYYFNADGYMLVGWQHINDEWYYLDTTQGSNMGKCWHEAPGGRGAMEIWYVE